MATAKKAPVKKVAPKAKVTLSSPAMDDKAWRARDDMHTLKQAAEIQSDKSRHNAAKAEASKHIQALSKIAK